MASTVKVTGEQLSNNATSLADSTIKLLDKIKNSKTQYTQMRTDLLAEYTRNSTYYLAVGESGGADTQPANDAAVAAVWGTGTNLDDWKCAKVVDREFIKWTPKMMYDYRVMVSTRLNNLQQFAVGVTGLTPVDLGPVLGTWSW